MVTDMCYGLPNYIILMEAGTSGTGLMTIIILKYT